MSRLKCVADYLPNASKSNGKKNVDILLSIFNAFLSEPIAIRRCMGVRMCEMDCIMSVNFP